MEDRINSFMARFSVNEKQALLFYRFIDSNAGNTDYIEKNLADWMMQTRDLNKIGQAYVDRYPLYKTETAANRAYNAALSELTADLMDEVSAHTTAPAAAF